MRKLPWVMVLCLLLGAWAQAPTQAAQRWAVVIGITAYLDDTIPKLGFPESDAVKLQEALVTHCGFRPDHIRLLTSSDATYVNIKEAFEEWLIPTVQLDDLVVVYFSGHGSQVDDDDEAEERDRLDEVILPYEAEKGKAASSIRDDQIEGWLSKLRTQKIVMIWDSCQMGNRSKGFAFTPTHRAKGDESKEEMSLDFGDYAFLSAVQEGEEAWESPDLRSGVFTHFVLQGIKGAADKAPHGNEDGSVTVAELGAYVAATAFVFSGDHCRSTQHPELVVRDDEMGATILTVPWPEVVRVSDELAVISVGEADGVLGGEQADVFNVYPESATPGGALEPIGELQVVEVREQEAAAKVLKGGDQIRPGCKVQLKLGETAEFWARVRINSLPSAEVYLGAEKYGETPTTIRVPAAKDKPTTHRLTLKYTTPGGVVREASYDLSVKAGEEKAISHRF